MDINLLVLNLGNSRLGIGVFSGGELLYTAHVAHAQRADWAAAIQQAWMQIAKSSGPAVAAASVNPSLAAPLEQAVREVTSQEIQWIGNQIDLPIKVRTEPPEQTGIDRILNVAAAYEQMGKACVVVDAGTAVTVDVCNDAGEFLGGAIAPGVAMQLDALHAGTAQLPQVKVSQFAAPSGPIGRNTAQAIL